MFCLLVTSIPTDIPTWKEKADSTGHYVFFIGVSLETRITNL